MALLEAGTTAPTFKGMNLLGGEFDLANVFGARGAVVSFAPDQINPAQVSWAKNLYEKNKTDVEMISIVRKLPSVSMAKAFLMQLGIKFPSVYDQKQEIFQLYGVETPVVLYSINKEGMITNVAQLEPKAFNAAAMQEAIDKAR